MNVHGIRKRLRKAWRIWLTHILLNLFPDTRGVFALRRRLLGPWFESFGRDVMLYGCTRFNRPQRITLGDNTVVNRGVIIDVSGETRVLVGRDVLIGPYCIMRSDDHVFERTDIPIREQGHAGADIVIDDDCWLGAHVVVLKGVRIGKGSVIGAGAVVTRDIPAYSIAVGAPARVIRKREQR